MKRELMILITMLSALLMVLISACGDGDSGDSNADGDYSENSDGDIESMPDGDDISDGDSDNSEEGEIDGDKNSDGDPEDSETDGDATEDQEDSEESENQESDGDEENAENDSSTEPEPSGIDGYMVAILYNLNTGDFVGHEISLLHLSETGEWTEETEKLEVHDFPRAATFTPNGNRLIVAQDSGWITAFDIRDGEAQFAWEIETEGYFQQIEALDYNRVLLMDGNHISNGGGLTILDMSTNPPTIDTDLLAFSAPSGFAIHPDEPKAAIFGVTPMDSGDDKYTDDMALADISGFPSLIEYFDLWGDATENANPMSAWPGFSPDGSMLAGGNDALWDPEVGVVKLFSYSDNEIAFLDSDEVGTPSGYAFSDNNEYLYIGSVESNRIHIFDVSGGTMEFVASQSGQDLVDQIIPIRKGPLAGHLLTAPYDGPALMKVNEDGTLEEISRFALDIDHFYMSGGMALGHEYE